ncbi:MAG: hypothetical protein WCK05_05145, partial [Planctomycetota bacterium]
GPQVSLTWTDNATNETGFLVQRSDNGGAFATIATPPANPGTGSVSYVDGTVQPGNTYAYRVCAVDVALASAFSNVAGVSLSSIPAAPTSLAAAVLAGPQVSLTWTDNAANETGFVVQRSDNHGAFATIATPAAHAGTGTVTYLDATVQFGNTYAYRVCVVNGPVIASAYSNAATVILLAAPTSLAAAPQLGPQVRLTWTDNATNEAAFVVRRSVNGGAFATVATPAANPGTGTVAYVDTTTLASNTYAYQVYAVNGAFVSTLSNATSVIFPASPSAPTNLVGVLKLKNGVPQITLTFKDTATNETGFIVERSVNGGGFVSLVTLPAKKNTGTVTYTDTGAAGNTYAYRVRAVNGFVPSAYTPSVTVAVDSVPAAPSNFAATWIVTSSTRVTFNFTWTDHATNETNFIIQRSTTAAFTTVTTFTVAANKTAFADSNQKRGVPYYYRILARNSFGDSAWVNLASFPITVL